MRSLDKKLVRDLRRMWAQALAIALVLAAGVSTLILAVGAYQSLEETRAAYYERYSFAHVFAQATRAPDRIARQIETFEGVAAVETRISKPAILDIEGFSPPVTGLVLSHPDNRTPRVNRLFLRNGRLPTPGDIREAVVNEAFAKAHKLTIGDRFQAILNGKKRSLQIVGIALSPEHIYAIGPGDLVPDDQRFAVLWLSEQAVDEVFDLDGAFNSILIRLLPGASEDKVIDLLDERLREYSGSGAYGRDTQISHAFLDAELQQLRAMAQVIPPIFLFVSAFLINMTLTRLVALEREQIGLLKALGYDRSAIAVHYIKFVLLIAAIGVIIGFGLGTWFGFGLTRLYTEFFHFPFLVFRRDPDVYLAAIGLSAGAALIGGVRAVFKVVALEPAVAMRPPTPPAYRRIWSEQLGVFKKTSQLTMMSVRHIIRWPIRAGFTVLGVALAGSLLIVSLFSMDSVEHMIDVTFSMIQRQDATLNLSDENHLRTLQAVGQLPGVMRTEPYRGVYVRMTHRHYEKKLSIVGKPKSPRLARVVDRSLQPISMPASGLVIGRRIAEELRLNVGDIVELEILSGWRGSETVTDFPFARAPRFDRKSIGVSHGPKGRAFVPVTDIVESYFGLSAFMELSALNRLIDEGYRISGIHIAYDRNHQGDLFEAVKSTPAIASIALHDASLMKFRETIAKNMNMMVPVYAGLAIVVALGVVYNSARIQLSEQARELASLRVLGFTKGEVSRVLLLELAILVIAAQPFMWALGYGFAWLVIKGFSSDLYRVDLIINLSTYAWASLLVLLTAIASALIVRRRIDRLDLISVLKTRE
ncbi:MAG: ABC transporter permease [Pseudomonadota bacterium]